VDFYFLHS
jgi:hypothetical protein